MKQIIGNSSTGKTKELMQLAIQNKGVYVCGNVDTAKVKALNYFGPAMMDLEIVSYIDVINLNKPNVPLFIDDLDRYLLVLNSNIAGYAITVE